MACRDMALCTGCTYLHPATLSTPPLSPHPSFHLQAAHSHVNHTFSIMSREDPNPFAKGSHEVHSWSQQP